MRDDWKTIYGDNVVRTDQTATRIVPASEQASGSNVTTIYGTKAASDYQGIVIRENNKVELHK